MEFWQKLNRASALTIAFSVLSAAIAVAAQKAAGADFSGLMAVTWLVVGFAGAYLAVSSPRERQPTHGSPSGAKARVGDAARLGALTPRSRRS